MGYTKLFNEIVMSTVWREPDHVRLLWITMLALKDRWHVVNASLPGLADTARITLEECQDALKVLSSPDPFSRTKHLEGRRITLCDGGWIIVNGEKYRNKMSLDERREYNRIKQREYRAIKKGVKGCVQSGTECTHTETDTESKALKEKDKKEKLTLPAKIKKDFKPTQNDYDLLLKKGINRKFAEGLLDEFISYWVERGEKRKTWSATFRNHTKAQWEYQQKNKPSSYQEFPE